MATLRDLKVLINDTYKSNGKPLTATEGLSLNSVSTMSGLLKWINTYSAKDGKTQAYETNLINRVSEASFDSVTPSFSGLAPVTPGWAGVTGVAPNGATPTPSSTTNSSGAKAGSSTPAQYIQFTAPDPSMGVSSTPTQYTQNTAAEHGGAAGNPPVSPFIQNPAIEHGGAAGNPPVSPFIPNPAIEHGGAAGNPSSSGVSSNDSGLGYSMSAAADYDISLVSELNPTGSKKKQADLDAFFANVAKEEKEDTPYTPPASVASAPAPVMPAPASIGHYSPEVQKQTMEQIAAGNTSPVEDIAAYINGGRLDVPIVAAAATAAGNILEPAAPAAPAELSQGQKDQIAGMYRQYLGREASTDEINGQGRHILNGGTMDQLNLNIANSPEARSYQASVVAQQDAEKMAGINAQVNSLFQQYVGRSADAADLQIHGSALATGAVSADQLKGQLAAAPESQNYRASLIENTFKQYVGRSADADDHRIHGTALASGAVTADQFKASIMAAPEAQAYQNMVNTTQFTGQ